MSRIALWTRRKFLLGEHRKLFILGNGGLAKEIRQYVDLDPARVYLIDEKDEAHYNHFVASDMTSLSVMGSGKMSIKRKLLNKIKGEIATIVHSVAVVMSDLGEGTVVAPCAVIGPDAKVGKHVLFNYGSTFGHDSTVGDLSVISPNAAVGGGCFLGKEVYVGSGASIRENLRVGDGSIIGMGAVVTKDVPPRVVAKGVPARFEAMED